MKPSGAIEEENFRSYFMNMDEQRLYLPVHFVDPFFFSVIVIKISFHLGKEKARLPGIDSYRNHVI